MLILNVLHSYMNGRIVVFTIKCEMRCLIRVFCECEEVKNIVEEFTKCVGVLLGEGGVSEGDSMDSESSCREIYTSKAVGEGSSNAEHFHEECVGNDVCELSKCEDYNDVEYDEEGFGIGTGEVRAVEREGVDELDDVVGE